jgi:hypothetical protein
MFKVPRRSTREILQTSTVRDFGGGLNVIDNDLNLSPRYAKVFTNTVRSPDNAVQVRWGTTLFSDVRVANTAVTTTVNNACATTNGQAKLMITWANHRVKKGQRVFITSSAAIGGIAQVNLDGWRVVSAVTASVVTITTGANATSTVATAGGNLTIAADNAAFTGAYAVAQYYFDDHIICVLNTGDIAAIAGDGVLFRIWDDNIAATRSGAPSGWGTTRCASMAPFGSDLIVCNGSDKPLLIKSGLYTEYLFDLATGSNVNTPICRYVRTFQKFAVMAGDPAFPRKVHISAKDACGTWYGDPAPNDATNVDLGNILTTGSPSITGMNTFRNQLIVGTINELIVGALGTYDGATHKPSFEETIEQYGVVAHATMQTLGDDLLFCDLVGVPSLERTLYTGTIRPDRTSQLVDPEIREALGAIDTYGGLEDRVFSVYNQREGQYMLFVPNDVDPTVQTESLCYVYTSVPALKVKAWSKFRGWNFICGCRSFENNIFFGTPDGKIYLYGSEGNPMYGDELAQYDGTWATATAYVAGYRLLDGDTIYVCNVAHTSSASGTFEGDRDLYEAYWSEYEGVPIEFDWQMPWADLNSRMETKRSKYLQLDVQGDAVFTVDMFIDNRLTNKLTQVYTPFLTMEFVGGDALGYGGGMQVFGAGRITSDERLWAWPAKFKLVKFRFHGSTTKRLKIVAFTVGYLNGSIRA